MKTRGESKQTLALGKPAKARSKPKATKTDSLLKLLRRRNGASLEELMIASSWQAHSVRGFLSGTVRKKMGLQVRGSNNSKGVRRYVIEDVGAVG